jgi:hypothetical protein
MSDIDPAAMEAAVTGAVEAHLAAMHEAGVIISPDQISDRTRRLIANQVRPHAVAALEAAAPHLTPCRCATLQAKAWDEAQAQHVEWLEEGGEE